MHCKTSTNSGCTVRDWAIHIRKVYWQLAQWIHKKHYSYAGHGSSTQFYNGDRWALELTLACEVDDPSLWPFEYETFDVPPEWIIPRACIDVTGAEFREER